MSQALGRLLERNVSEVFADGRIHRLYTFLEPTSDEGAA